MDTSGSISAKTITAAAVTITADGITWAWYGGEGSMSEVSLSVARAAKDIEIGASAGLSGKDLQDTGAACVSQGTSWGLARRLLGERVVLTGTMSLSRASMTKLVGALGGATDSSVGHGTTLLVTSDDEGRTRTVKRQEAERRGVVALTESEFVEVLTLEPDELLGETRVASFRERLRELHPTRVGVEDRPDLPF